MTCEDCGADLDAIPVGEPCTDCGGHRRGAVVHALVGTATVTATAPAMTIGHAQVPTWQTLWAQIDRRLGRLQDAYDPNTPHPGSNTVVEDDTDALLLCLFHLSEWLEHDATLPASLRAEAGPDGAAVKGSPALLLARDYANSFKHHTRRGSAARFARLHEAASVGNTEQITVQHWTRTAGVDGPVTTVDALQLAEACRADWVTLLTAHGVPVPNWMGQV